MKKIALALVFLILASPCHAEDRYPFVAGSFYPSDKNELSSSVDTYLRDAKTPQRPGGRLIGLIVPHAGHFFSGHTAGSAYRLLQERPAKIIVLLGPYHKTLFHGASVWTSGSWQTPLGDVPVDTELAKSIAGENTDFQFSESAHAAEHSLEVQLPFLQKTLKDYKIVPILVTDASSDNTNALAAALYKHLKGRDAVVIASTDLSHYHPDEKARTIDARTLELIKARESGRFFEAVRSGEAQACGDAAVLTLLQYSKLEGGTSVQHLDYSTSADATNDKNRVVGYGACALWAGPGPAAEAPMLKGDLSALQKKKLLTLARATVATILQGLPVPSDRTGEAFFDQKKAVFVTLKKAGQLRGCIGNLEAQEPLEEAVRHMAAAAAFKDPRFSPVQPQELEELTFEISVLSDPVQVPNADAIVMGKHGVIVRQGSHAGVFLPQVAEMMDWDKNLFLNELCSQKAGLPEGCWKDASTTLWVFTADAFSENS